MSRSTPPAATEASCASSPTRRTLAPRAKAKLTTWARSAVAAIAASSIRISDRESIRVIQCGRGALVSWVRCQTSLATVSVCGGVPWVGVMFSRSMLAAAAEGANPMMVAPAAVQARVRVARAVVLPDPAGAMATCTRALEVARARTRWAWASLRDTPLARASSSATSTWVSLMLCPSVRAAASRMTCSAARIASLVYRRDPATSYTLFPSARRNGSGVPPAATCAGSSRDSGTLTAGASTAATTCSIAVPRALRPRPGSGRHSWCTGAATSRCDRQEQVPRGG